MLLQLMFWLLLIRSVILYPAGSLHLCCLGLTHSHAAAPSSVDAVHMLWPQAMPVQYCDPHRKLLCYYDLIQPNSVIVCCFRPRAAYSHSHSHSQASVGSSAEERQSRPVSASHHAASRGNSQGRPASSPQGRRGLSPAPSGQTLS